MWSARKWLLALLLLALICSCQRGRAPEKPAPPSEAEQTRLFLESNETRFQLARARATGWLDRLTVDPLELREHGIKGKKKLAELVDSYCILHNAAPPAEKSRLMDRLRQVAAVTYEPRYHDMATVNDHEFKEDSTSYLRVAYLMDRHGLDIALYREEIKKVQPRLDAHLATRGSHQLMAFHWYYQYFGLTEPFDLASGFEKGVIKSRLPVEQYTYEKAYALTHEIFVPYHYGEDLDADFFSAEDKAYLRPVLEKLTAQYIQKGDPDLTGELVISLRYLKFSDGAIYRDALEYLLSAQRPDGSWGDYEDLRPRFGDYVQQGFYLHTTYVAVNALVMAFAK